MTRFEREHYDLVPAPRRPFTKLDEASGTRLLDVATGPNALVAEAANRGARPFGIDLSPQMITGAATVPRHCEPLARPAQSSAPMARATSIQYEYSA
jgi:2-polyprenyl-3-methyl-5-hydroxy-6-metoxy-1,4-benzoquinol methylase